MKEELIALLNQAVADLVEKGELPADLNNPGALISIPKERKFGDYATNLAMLLTKQAKMPPRDVAAKIIEALGDGGGLVAKAEIAGPGFINLFIRQEGMFDVLSTIENQGDRFGQSDLGQGRKTMVEFVSANPTGPLHIGHGRNAVYGDTVGRLLTASGYEVYREYYVNDAGFQINTLGKSTFLRYRQLLGDKIEIPEGHYVGEYLLDIAADLRKDKGDALTEEDIPEIALYAAEKILNSIKRDCVAVGVNYDNWFSEKTLHDDGTVDSTLEKAEADGLAFKKDGALWFATEKFGDDKDRVLVKSDGSKTYFAADVAYHANKFARGFDLLINVWGADHHGYIARMKAAVEAMGRSPEDLDVQLIQMVSLIRGGQLQQMSTRSGTFVTLQELIDEVGSDAIRYFYLMRRHDAQLEFDIDLALERSNKNPVFYVQYMHARICSIFAKAGEEGIEVPPAAEADLSPLELAEEKEIVRHLAEYPRVVNLAATAREPHRLVGFMYDLAGMFHKYYHDNRVVSDDKNLTVARLVLCRCCRQVLRNALTLAGISAPEKM